MAYEVGQRVIAGNTIHRRRFGTDLRPSRYGVIEEVLRGDPRPRYRIRWTGGTVSVHSPSPGGLILDPDQDKVAAEA